MKPICLRALDRVLLCGLLLAGVAFSHQPARAAARSDPAALFARDRLIAWCIVPFDAKKRGPEDRAAMLEQLGFKHFAYDWRAEHIPTFDAEVAALQRHGIRLDAFWFPPQLDAHARLILDLLARHKIKTQLWVTGGGEPTKTADEQRARVATEAARLRPIVEAAGKIGCAVGLYNHGGWFGEPKNQLAILAELKLPNVGLVYNLHHGHAHVDRFAALLEKMKPHLLAVNLNGMDRESERQGNKIMPLGQGELDLQLLRTLVDSGYPGPFGILGHTQDDARERLLDNLEGLDWLVKQLQGQPAGPRPKPRTWRRKPAAAAVKSSATSQLAGWLIDGRSEYRRRPLTIACSVQLEPRAMYSIIAACDTKASGTHWELFTMPGSGYLAAYLPGMRPDHLRSTVNVSDRQPHHVALSLETDKGRLLVDGRVVAEQDWAATDRTSIPGPLAIGRLVEGTLDCAGEIREVQIIAGIAADGRSKGQALLAVSPVVVGHWKFSPRKPGPIEDLSSLHNPARPAGGEVGTAPMPPPGIHLTSADPRLRMQLIDRSPDQAYMAVKADGAGRLFVGGREAVFVFEPDGRGGFGPRQTLMDFGDDAIIIGLELRGDDLYVMTSSALYRIPEGRTRRTNLRPERLLWGLPLDLHVSFHCLAWGPQGDLYLDHGDPLLNYGDWSRPDHWGHWTLFAGRKNTPFPYNGAGSVLRMRPDGEQLQVVAGGLRGPVGLAFDDRWNLFTNDNDHESRADQYAPARLLHVVPHVDFGWPRGWMASKSPDRADLIEPMTAELGRGVPCDLLYFDEPSWPDQYRRQLLMCRWDRSSVMSYPLGERGASFATAEREIFRGDNNARPVGIAADTRGRLFVTSLYLAGNTASPHCASDIVMITPPDVPHKSLSPRERLGEGKLANISEATPEVLWNQLASASSERRRRAHHEVLRRGGSLLDEAARRFCAADEHATELTNLAWLAGATGSPEVTARLLKMARAVNPEQRVQALRVLTEYPRLQPPPALFVSALDDSSPAVRLAALEYFFGASQPLPLSQIVHLAGSENTYLRQIAARLLAQRATPAELAGIAQASAAADRMAAVLAIGMRLTTPPLGERLPADLKLFYPRDSTFFKSKLKFADRNEPVDLRDLGRIGAYTAAERWRVERSDLDEPMFQQLSRLLDDVDGAVVLQAAYYLGLLNDPRTEPQIAQAIHRVWRNRLQPLPSVTLKQIWVLGPMPADLASRVPTGENGVDLSATYPASEGSLHWHVLSGAADGRFVFESDQSSGGRRFFGTFTLQSRQRQKALLSVSWPGRIEARLAGRSLVFPASESPRQAVLDLQAGSNDLVLEWFADHSDAETLTVHCAAAGGLSAEVPEQLTGALLAERLRAASGAAGTALPRELAEADWPTEVRRGNAGQGRRLFATLGCAKCHAVSPEQAGGGAPSLADARRRFNVAHLVESILLPSKQVAEPFRASTLVMDDGRVLSGLVVSESAESVELLHPDGSHRVLRAGEIEERTRTDQSPMSPGLVKTVAELRDLLAYLTSDRPLPP